MKRFISLLFLGGLLLSFIQPGAIVAAIDVPPDCAEGDTRAGCKLVNLSPFQKLSHDNQAKAYTQLMFLKKDLDCDLLEEKDLQGINLFKDSLSQQLHPWGLHDEPADGDGKRSCGTATFGNLTSAVGYSGTKAWANEIDYKTGRDTEDTLMHLYNNMVEELFGCGTRGTPPNVPRITCNDALINKQRAMAHYWALIYAFRSPNGCKAGDAGEAGPREITEIGENGQAVKKSYSYERATVDVGYGIEDGANISKDDGKMECATIADRLSRNDGAITKQAISWQAALDKVTGANYLNQVAGSLSGAISGGGDDIVCNMGPVGWLICPIAQATANITDASYAMIEELLALDPIGFDFNSPLYIAWSNARNLANIFFIGALFVIVYSQLTGIGISNYGIKKLLPQIIATAILVNISYFLCVFLIDLSNIFGANIDEVIDSGTRGFSGTGNGVEGWNAVIAGVLAAGAATGAAALAIGPLAGLAFTLLLGAAVGIGITLMMLVIREAIVPLWIVASALALMFRLLPGTTKVYDIWKGTGKVILIMYPVIALIHSVGQLAADIIRNSGR